MLNLLNKEKFLKYKYIYKNLKLNMKGSGYKCHEKYEILFDKLKSVNDKNKNDITKCLLKFISVCDKDYSELREDVKRFDNSDICYRAVKRCNDKYYNNTYNPSWFESLIKKVCEEKTICIKSYI